MRMYENWLLRSIFGPKRKEVTGGWRKLPHEKLHNFTLSEILLRSYIIAG
jgi:hypothetical protein